MKLSEAIIAGSNLHPQGHFDFYHKGQTCALGAAFEAVEGVIDESLSYDEIVMLFPQLNRFHHYDSAGLSWDLADTIIYMNDQENKSREEIAVWLEEQGY